MYSRYTRPMGDMIRSHGVLFHLFADDSQVYLPTNPNNPEQQLECFKQIKSCISDLSNWMFNNKLKVKTHNLGFLVVLLMVITPFYINLRLFIVLCWSYALNCIIVY